MDDVSDEVALEQLSQHRLLLRLDSIDNQLIHIRQDLTGLFTAPLLATDVARSPHQPVDDDDASDTDMERFVPGNPFCSCSLGDWISLTLCR